MSEFAAYEALLFVAGEEGLTLTEMAQLNRSTIDHVKMCMLRLKEEYDKNSQRGLTLIETADSYRLVTKKNLSQIIQLYAQSPLSKKLSKASVETLAVIAYKQPVTRLEIEEIRGVQLSSSLQKLKSRGLIEEIGRLDAPGKPVLYGTTDYFLDYFGLNDLTELPELELEEQPVSQTLFDETLDFG